MRVSIQGIGLGTAWHQEPRNMTLQLVTSSVLPTTQRKLPLRHLVRYGHQNLVVNLNPILRNQEDSVRPVGSGCLEACTWD